MTLEEWVKHGRRWALAMQFAEGNEGCAFWAFLMASEAQLEIALARLEQPS